MVNDSRRRTFLASIGAAAVPTVVASNASAASLPSPTLNPRDLRATSIRLKEDQNGFITEQNSSLGWHGIQDGAGGSYDHIFTLATNAGSYKPNDTKEPNIVRHGFELRPDPAYESDQQHYVDPNQDDKFFQAHPNGDGAIDLSPWMHDAIDFTANAAAVASQTFGALWAAKSIIESFKPAEGGRRDDGTFKWGVLASAPGGLNLPLTGWKQAGHSIRFTISVPQNGGQVPSVESFVTRQPTAGSDNKDMKAFWDIEFGSDPTTAPTLIPGYDSALGRNDDYTLAGTEFANSGSGGPTLPGPDPKDLDNDGLYEDFNGDGSFGFPDVNEFFQEVDSPAVQRQAEYFDFTSSGDVNLQDVLALFERV